MRRLAWCCCALAAVSVMPRAEAASPDWSALGDSVLMTRLTWMNPVGESFNGVWRYDPLTGEYERVRPFLPTIDSDTWYPHGFDGRDGFLAAHGDTLSFSTWPMRVDFDLFSWRLLRRLPTSEGASEIGWVVQGPVLLTREAGQLGLVAGTYGIGRCVRHIVTSGGEAPPLFCGLNPYPGVGDPDSIGDDGVILHRVSATTAEDRFVADVGSFDWESVRSLGELPVGLSIDRARSGFWRPAPRGGQLLPVDDGSFLSPPAPVDFGDLIPADHEVSRLFYHERTGVLLGTAQSVIGGVNSGDNRRFFRWDPASDEGEVLGSWTLGLDNGAPDTMAAVREQPDEYVQTVPIISAGPGKRGTEWVTELWMYNPLPAPITVSVRRVAAPDQQQTVVLAGHASLAVPDALAWVGGGPGGDGVVHDALVVTAPFSWGAQLRVDGRISTANQEGSGRYGHAVPSVPGRVGYSNHLAVRNLPHDDADHIGVKSAVVADSYLHLDLREPGRFRFNLGVVNDEDEPLTMTFVWSATQIDAIDMERIRIPETIQAVEIAPHTVRIVSLLDLFPSQVTDAWPPRIGVTGSHPAVVWLSIVDNATGDATFVPYTSVNWGNDNYEDTLALPVVARTPGARGSTWVTDLLGYQFYEDESDLVVVRYWPEDPGGDCAGASGTFQALLGEFGSSADAWGRSVSTWRRVIPDVVSVLDGCGPDPRSKGALEISSASWTMGYSRTYTTRPDGGTYGSMLPLYPPHGWPVQHFAGLAVSDDSRVNLGLYNGLDSTVVYRLEVFAADGSEAATVEVELSPREHRQERLQQLVGGLPHGLYGLTVTPLDDPSTGVEGRSWAYVSIVDNGTNDPVNLW